MRPVSSRSRSQMNEMQKWSGMDLGCLISFSAYSAEPAKSKDGLRGYPAITGCDDYFLCFWHLKDQDLLFHHFITTFHQQRQEGPTITYISIDPGCLSCLLVKTFYATYISCTIHISEPIIYISAKISARLTTNLWRRKCYRLQQLWIFLDGHFYPQFLICPLVCPELTSLFMVLQHPQEELLEHRKNVEIFIPILKL